MPHNKGELIRIVRTARLTEADTAIPAAIGRPAHRTVIDLLTQLAVSRGGGHPVDDGGGPWLLPTGDGTSGPFGGLLVVCTFTALQGGTSPVPEGMGVMEASYNSGLTLLGVQQDLAVAASLTHPFATTYLPPLWVGVLFWPRRHDAL